MKYFVHEAFNHISDFTTANHTVSRHGDSSVVIM